MKTLRRIFRIAGWGAAAIVALAVLAVAGILGYSAWSGNEARAIDPQHGIDEAMYVEIGGLQQWVQIRGRDRNNPVILWLNGGPGYSTIPQTPFYANWEAHFTVVMWDQRGEGKTFERSGAAVADAMTIDRFVRDGLALGEFLSNHLPKRKIILLGHSWGSIIGIEMVKRRPDLFAAYVGTGQVVNLAAGMATGYGRLLHIAEVTRNDATAGALRKAGAPPYASIENYWVPLSLQGAYSSLPRQRARLAELWPLVEQTLAAPSYLDDGAMFSQRLMLKPMLAIDIENAPDFVFKLPIFFIQGSDDMLTPTDLARKYFDRIEAPTKKFVVIQGTGHLAVLRARDKFLDALVTNVRPIVAQ